jgi:fumarate reductase subunit D
VPADEAGTVVFGSRVRSLYGKLGRRGWVRSRHGYAASIGHRPTRRVPWTSKPQNSASDSQRSARSGVAKLDSDSQSSARNGVARLGSDSQDSARSGLANSAQTRRFGSQWRGAARLPLARMARKCLGRPGSAHTRESQLIQMLKSQARVIVARFGVQALGRAVQLTTRGSGPTPLQSQRSTRSSKGSAHAGAWVASFRSDLRATSFAALEWPRSTHTRKVRLVQPLGCVIPLTLPSRRSHSAGVAPFDRSYKVRLVQALGRVLPLRLARHRSHGRRSRKFDSPLQDWAGGHGVATVARWVVAD